MLGVLGGMVLPAARGARSLGRPMDPVLPVTRSHGTGHGANQPASQTSEPTTVKTLLHDLRYGLRVLGAAPAFTAAAVVCLALGIGATSAIFTVVHAVVVKPLPYREPDRLVRVYSEFPNFPNGGLRRFWISPPEFLDLTRETKSWESLDA